VTASFQKLGPTQVELDIQVSSSDLDLARERAYRKLVKQFRIPGFRPGHVPRRIFEQYVGAARIEEEAMEDVVPAAYAGALREHSLEPVAQPKIDLERVDEGKSLRIKALVDVRPEIALGAYKEIKTKLPPVDVSDDEVERSLQALRKRAATLTPVTDRGVKSGDVITLDYAGRIDGNLFEGGSAVNHTTEVSDEQFVPGFAQQLYGAMPGERREVRVTFPAEYHTAALAGKSAAFDVVVHDIKVPVLPELDAAFAKSVSDNETVESLRTDIRKRLELVAGQRARESAEQEFMQSLLSAHDFPLPEVLVEREVERMLSDVKESIERSGRSWERDEGADEAKLRKDMRPRAEQRVKSTLLVDEIAKAERIEAGGSDVDREIGRMARSMNQPPERVLGWLREGGGLARLIDSIRREKTIDVLVTRATASANDSDSPAGQQESAAT